MSIAANLLLSQDADIRFSHLTSDDGLPTNQVNDILRDTRGFWWIGSHSGLSRYDGSSFKHFTRNENDSTSLLSDQVYTIYEDPLRRLWVMTSRGICVYDPRSEQFTSNLSPIFRELEIPYGNVQHMHTDSEGKLWMVLAEGLYLRDISKKTTVLVNPVPEKKICYLSEGKNGDMWIIFRDGTFAQLDHNLEMLYRNDELAHKSKDERFRIVVDHDGDLWIYSKSGNSGVYNFQVSSRSFRHISTKSQGIRIKSDIVSDVEIGTHGWIWICADHGGITLVNKNTGSVKNLVHDPLDDGSLSNNTTTFIYKDNGEVFWIGTYKHGLNYFHESLNSFKLYQHSSLDPNSLPFNDINGFAEDRKGNLWIGTNGGGLVYFDRVKKIFRQYLHDPDDPASLSSNVIVSLCVDRSDHLWIGTYFGGLDYLEDGKFVHYRHVSGDENQISDNSVWDITEDFRGNIWIATLLGSLNKFDLNTKRMFHYARESGIYSPYITSILQDVDSSIWVGSGYGLTVLSENKKVFSHFQADTGNGSLSSNQITCIYKDAADVLWIGTQEGLNIYDRSRKIFRHLKTPHGLPDNEIKGVAADDFGKIWVSTAKGVSALEITGLDSTSDNFIAKVTTYDVTDGLQGKQFNTGAIIKTTDGHLFFGGTNGFNELPKIRKKEHRQIPTIAVSKLFIDNSEVRVGQLVNGKVILEKSITDTHDIVLSPGYNSFSIGFSALSVLNNSEIRFRYRLVGFDKDWVETNSQRSAHYTSIDPGTYELIASVAGRDGIWHDNVAGLRIKILPPFWKSKPALFAYMLLIFFTAVLGRYLLVLRERSKYETEKAKEEQQRALEFDRMKIKFITNVSHEFRTPLSLILLPVEAMLQKQEKVVTISHENLQLIHRNARRLLNLVNQLLDFRRLEMQEVKLHASNANIVSFIGEAASSFADLAERKKINFLIESKVHDIAAAFDANKIERIIFNLISNAFKFTPEGGAVIVVINKCAKNGADYIQVDVKDTGIGIPPEHLEKIFDRFFQSGPATNGEGSGIGLSITREFVRLHGGEIQVTSEVNKGSCFSVFLPIHQNVDGDNDISESSNAVSEQIGATRDSFDSDGRRVLLLVEDNDDFRFYLKDNLKHKHVIYEARNGAEGWKKILEVLPDIVVSDIMMPEMDGIELCHKIRSDKRTSHVPVILLTARSSEEQRLEGLQTGADDYIAKPFNFEILQARIGNLLAQRSKFHMKFQQTFEIRSSEINISSLDEILIQKAIKAVEEHISDPDFSVEDLGRVLGISRAHLYRKLQSLTGKSAIEFIRIIKLQRAAQLLGKSQLSVAEVAYQVGFNNPKYFTKYFKEHYKVLPSAYARAYKEKPGSQALL